MEPKGIEPLLSTCKADVLPLSLRPQYSGEELNLHAFALRSKRSVSTFPPPK